MSAARGGKQIRRNNFPSRPSGRHLITVDEPRIDGFMDWCIRGLAQERREVTRPIGWSDFAFQDAIHNRYGRILPDLPG